MQHNHKPFEPDDQDLPEGWDPNSEVDPQLETILRLAHESATPEEELRPAAVEGMRLATRRQLFAERLIHADDLKPRGGQSFSASVRRIFFGGGAPAQLLRLGITAGVAFAVGTGLLVGTEGTSTKQLPVLDVKSPSAAPVAEVNTPSKIAPVAGNEEDIVSAARKGREVASVQAKPDSLSGLNGVPISRSAVTDMENGGWMSTAPSSPRWGMSQGAGPIAVSNESYPPSVARSIDEVQYLKMNALANGDDASMSNLRNLDQTLSQLMMQYEVNKQQPKLTALQRLQQADAMSDAHRYRDAISEFERVQQLAPGTPLALISEIRIGQIAYEKLGDFELAKDSFQNCIDKYPGVSVTPEAQSYVASRLDVLKGTAADNWASLSAWRDAEHASTAAQAVPMLLKIVTDCEYPELVARASMRLRDYALGRGTALDVDAQQVSGALDARIAKSRANQHTARMQFALAEITMYRLRNFNLALEQYQAALGMNPDAETQRQIQTRIAQLESLGGDRVALPAAQ
ncbi:hypothetical protein IT570_08340 [Candidatus Sumerlaeota bacterium]|nr:hypothetical protein [Candidatus Sumerlaeota bacterium]